LKERFACDPDGSLRRWVGYQSIPFRSVGKPGFALVPAACLSGILSMNSRSQKSVLLAVLVIPLMISLFLVWIPMVRMNNQAAEDAGKAIRESKETIERTKLEMERIENATPRMPRIPAGDEQAI
jgi:hypothetical protein